MGLFDSTECHRALKRIATGDSGALEIIYERMGKQIYVFALSLLENESEAEDVMQETFLRIMNSAGTYSGVQRNARAWILSITRNLSVDRIRRRKFVSEEEKTGVRSDVTSKIDDRDEVDRLMDILNAEEKQIVILRAVHRFKYSEIGKITGETEDNARMKYVRAIEKMRKQAKRGKHNER